VRDRLAIMDTERLLATSEVAMEYSALSNFDANEGHCPQGMSSRLDFFNHNSYRRCTPFIQGIYVVPCTESVLLWEGVVFVHQGMRKGLFTA
jgi:hypothetical protein